MRGEWELGFFFKILPGGRGERRRERKERREVRAGNYEEKKGRKRGRER